MMIKKQDNIMYSQSYRGRGRLNLCVKDHIYYHCSRPVIRQKFLCLRSRKHCPLICILPVCGLSFSLHVAASRPCLLPFSWTALRGLVYASFFAWSRFAALFTPLLACCFCTPVHTTFPTQGFVFKFLKKQKNQKNDWLLPGIFINNDKQMVHYYCI